MPRQQKIRSARAPTVAETFGQQLRRHRINQSLSQEQLAERAGVAPGTISSAELGRGRPRSDTVLKLAKALKLGGQAHGRFIEAAQRVGRSKSAGGRIASRKQTSRPQNARPLRVFLCHSSGDKTTVRKLYKRLKAEPGILPWLDEEDLVGGQEWDAEIMKAVRASDVVIVCLSRDSTTKTGYVQKEMRLALDAADMRPPGTIFLIPLKLEECDIPDDVSRRHWVDYRDGAGYSRLMKALQTRISLRDRPKLPSATASKSRKRHGRRPAK